MLCIEHQLIIYREIKARSKEFEQLDQRDKLKSIRKRVSEEEYEKAILKKSKTQIAAYRAQQERIKAKAKSAPNEGTLNPEKEHSGQK